MTLREKLIVLRDKAGITQMALAHQLGVSRQAEVAGGYQMGKRRHSAVYGQAEGTGEDLRRIAGLVVQ